MRFIVDAQLPPSLARALTNAGHPSEAARNLHLHEAEDTMIWEYATAHQYSIITKDEDFAARVLRTTSGPAVVWLRMGNCSNQDLLHHLIPLLEAITERIESGDRLIEVS